ncbi:bifunctional nicotinamide-nucleotide adenylyltransferase/Nudix hydroxylase [Microbulbifer thermotolerans]|uniref:ADP-ribose pyrophosphatase n=1 Tax=Microbulbifer thermotolerans TaxID=252514 RepID=A0A143HLG4_MICTH|nr:bifunctional nicotinamide-nucleotide adenylyltransferase/Nudix hydroxylase [Microbulbifer thermotolerans]AMX02565.1 ADP-ribose pyrophosphatase [Microbulbifer thermotolerans]MCX2779703.1 bifunctional nicotinamide-nucleotide adenylyltransferase/Nudix hydroxylase [Microbulbifer thermotolerans]MCX2782365.1 bifunctional nicotinamide-nucleotide adenylyltransferase/Nudix hydroxylase [Microbulbifer thermotolerans]MCX2794954.1 bifunctional nicotinamide-nucleotide adenylyltransferase/Nudix hydroxylase
MFKTYDFAVFIGRFQPFHAGHLKVVEEGLSRAEHLIVLIGSAFQPRNLRNPWTHEEREAQIRACLPAEDNRRLICLPLMDVPYNDELWVRNVQTSVNGIVTAHHSVPHKPPKIALIGHRKDHTGFYLSLFPQWDSVGIGNFNGISATAIRERIFSDNATGQLHDLEESRVLPPPVAQALHSFVEADPAYQAIRKEAEFVAKYKASWAAAPYPPTHVTVDAVVVQSGHVLLVKRRAYPGRGLWALPGGFVDPHEKLVDACLRELREETRLKVPAPVLKGSIRRQKVFDDPHRSARGRTITHAFYIELEPNSQLPKVKGGDDASHAKWVPLGALNPREMFEDHYAIIQSLMGAA